MGAKDTFRFENMKLILTLFTSILANRGRHPNKHHAKNKNLETNCEDTYNNCKSMEKLCRLDSYAGVARYCQKTCNTCGQESRDGIALTTTPMTTLAPVVIRQLECKDAKWCNPLMCEFGRYEKDCPVVCGHPKCLDNEHTAPESAKLEQCKDSATGNCAAIAKFCNHPIHGQSNKLNRSKNAKTFKITVKVSSHTVTTKSPSQ